LIVTTALGQVSSLDSNSVKVDKQEFKHIINTNISYWALDSSYSSLSKSINLLKLSLNLKDSIIVEERNKFNIMETFYKDKLPPFWDNFLYGAITTILVFLGLSLL